MCLVLIFSRLSFVVLVFLSFLSFFFKSVVLIRIVYAPPVAFLVAPFRKYIFIHANACPGDANAEEETDQKIGIRRLRF